MDADRPHDPGQQRHSGLDVGEEGLRDADPREDVRDGAEPRSGARAAERAEQHDHPDPRQHPVKNGKDPHCEGEGHHRQQRPHRIHRTHVRIREERPTAGYLRDPHRQAAARVRVVDCFFHRQVVDEKISTREIPAGEHGVGVHGQKKEQEQHRRDQPAAPDPIGVQVRRPSLARTGAAVANARTGAKREISIPGRAPSTRSVSITRTGGRE